MTNTTNRAAEDLINCLQKQAAQFRVFLELLARQRDALVERDAARLDRVVAEQEAAIAESRKLEQQRRALTQRLAATLGEGPDAQTLSGIAELVAASDASRLTEMQEMLSGLQREVERRKRLNQTLIEQSMRCTGEALQWIAQRMRPQPVYGRNGAAPGPGAGQIAVNRNC